MHRGHDVGPDAQFRKEHQERHRGRREQRQRQHEADRAGALRIVGGERANELIGVHSHRSRSFAVRLLSPRCSATRTAPSLMEYFAAVSLIEALSTAIDCSTSRWRAGTAFRLAATSLAVAASAAGGSGRGLAKWSMLTTARLPQ